MYLKTFLPRDVAQFAVDHLVTSFWTNPHSQVKQPQITIGVDGEEYWLDINEKNGELISVHSCALMSQPGEDSDMADILSRAEYLKLCDKIEAQIFQLRSAYEQKEMLLKVVNDLNRAYLAGAKHA